MAQVDDRTKVKLETSPECATLDALDANVFRFVRVLPTLGEAYWTVVDPANTIVESADGYLKFLRFELGAEELTTKQYARNIACFLSWIAARGVDLQSAAAELQAFESYPGSTEATPDEAPLARPKRMRQVLAAVRGLYFHLVEHEVMPLEVLCHLQEIVELGDSGVISHSQNGEDLQIAYYLGREHVTYVDVGCLWPRDFSNSYFFYERGGYGLCIDANPTVAEEHIKQRPRDTFLNCGVAATAGAMTYYMHENPVFNTFSAEHAAALAERVAEMEDSPQRKGRTLIETAEIPVMTLDEAVISTGFAARCGGHVDFLSIDVEGLELEVLAGFGFHELRPRLVVVEDVRRGSAARLAPDQLPIAEALKTHRYWLAGRSGINLYFMDEDR
jgi:FkbM family methyltransferase